MLAALLGEIAERWPSLAVDPPELAAALVARGLSADHPLAPDLALALALARHDRVALAVFDREVTPALRAALTRFDRGPDFIDEALQRTRVKLLVVGEGAPRILDYAGRGSLKAWITVVAVREALLLLRATAREVPGDDDLMRVAFTEPVLARAREAHKRELSASFRAALESLDPRERNLLRLCFVEGVGTEELARLFRVHRTTAFRWLRDARSKVLARTRDEFLARVGITASEADSVMRSLAESLSVTW
jgi:RNA polymerase sigma-70 factor (ECF subfamily)